jgi:hypothetical protein
MTQITLKIALVQVGSGEPLEQPEWTACPNDVEADTLLSYLTQQFGEPIEVALTSTEKNPRIVIGWFFRPPAGQLTGPADDIELLVIPYITLEDGSDVAMFLHQANQKELFETLAVEGKVDELTLIEQPQREYEPQQ